MDKGNLIARIAEAGSLSLDAIRQTLRAAISEYNADKPWEQCAYVIDVVGTDEAGDVILEINSQLWRAPYAIASSNKSRSVTVKISKAERVFPQTAYVKADGIVIEAQREKLLKLLPQSPTVPVNPETNAKEALVEGEVVPLREAETEVTEGARIPVKIIAPGQGSSGFYSEAVLQQAAKDRIFSKGMHCYWNHQTDTEEAERPEGDLRDLAGVLVEDAKWQKNGVDGPGLYSTVETTNAYTDAVKNLAPHIGMSIRAFGLSKPGKDGPVIEKFTRGKSVDFVTRAGAGGKILELFEAARAANPTVKESEQMDEAQVKALVEGAVAPLRTELTGVKDANVKLTEANTKLTQEAATLKRNLVTAEAKTQIAALVAKESIPAQAKARVADVVLSALPLTDAGDLDTAKLAEAIKAEAKREADYLVSIGGQQLTGFGPSGPVDVKESDVNKRITEEAAAMVPLNETGKRFAQIFGEGRV